MLIGIASVVALLSSSATTMAGTWQTTPTPLSNTTYAAQPSPNVVVDDNGTATAVWRERLSVSRDAVFAARCVNGTWSAPVDISTGSVRPQDPAVAVDDSGVVTVVWGDNGSGHVGVYAARFVAGAWGSPATIDLTGSASFASATVDANGAVTAVWVGAAGGLPFAKAARFTTGWGTVQLLADHTAAVAFDAEVVVDAAGVVTAAWSKASGIGTARFNGSAWTTGSFAVGSAAAVDTSLAVLPNGTVRAVWRNDATVYAASNNAGTWGSAEPIAADADTFSEPAIATASGTLTAVWVSYSAPSYALKSRALVDGVWREPRTVETSSGGMYDPDVVAADGAVTAFWLAESGSETPVRSARFAEGAWGSGTWMPSGDAGYPTAAADLHGVVTLLWQEGSGTPRTVHALRYVVSPAPPTAVRATAGDRSASVSWTTPTYDGGSALTGYTVTANPGGGTCRATAPATACTVTGLTAGTAYAFTVTATNGFETSSASAPSVAVTVGPAAAASPDSAPTVRAIPLRLTARNGTVSTTFAKVKGATSYAMRAERSLRASGAKAGSCTAKGSKVTCRVKLPPGRWIVTVTASSKTAVLARTTQAVTVKRAAGKAPARPGVAG